MEVNKQLTLEIFSQLEKKWLTEYDSSSRSSSPWSPKLKKKKTCILTIDGGVGVSGLLAGESLIHLEDCIKSKTSNPDARITDFFDLVAGTGVGGILAVLITATSDSSSRTPLFSARSAVDFLWSNIHHLFRPAGILRRRRYKYSTKSLEILLKRVLKSDEGRSLTLKDVCKPVLIPCYDLNSSAPFVFSSSGASESQSFNFDLWRICRATSATPGLFKPCTLTSADGKTKCNAVDGGLVMNNPAAAAVTHAVHNKRDFPEVFGSEDLVVLSLGNACSGGASQRRRRNGSGECDRPAVVEIALDGVSDAVDQVLCNAFSWNRTDYIRIQGNGVTMTEDGGETKEQTAEVVRSAGTRMLRERGVESLPFGGKRLMTESNGERIEGLVQRLITMSVAGGKDQPPPSPAKSSAVTVLTDSRASC